VIFDAHPKEFIGVKLQQTVFLTGLDKYISIVCTVQKKALDKGLAPLKVSGKIILYLHVKFLGKKFFNFYSESKLIFV